VAAPVSFQKGKKAEPKAAFITTAGTHFLCDGKWKVEVVPVDPVKFPGFLRVEFTRPDGKWIAFNNHFSEKWPWYVFTPSADMAMFYDGNKQMNLLTLSANGHIQSNFWFGPPTICC
jgi:hypothetical protein